MKYNMLFPIILIGIGFYCFITSFSVKADQTENTSPQVNVSTSLNNNRFHWNALVNYSISVSDKEDGTSEFNEIAPNEVLLKVVYLSDSAKIKKYLFDKTNYNDVESKGISLIKTLACFSCHASKSKLIGPSFDLIAKRYPYNATSLEILSNKLRNGSIGVWGNTPMPKHPDLKAGQAREMVRWILKNNKNPDVTYLPGIQGAFRTRQKPEKNAGKGVYILTASYMDHGIKGQLQSRKSGQQTIILKN